MVFQNYALYPHMTIEQNMGFSLRLAKTAKSKIKARDSIVSHVSPEDIHVFDKATELRLAQQQSN